MITPHQLDRLLDGLPHREPFKFISEMKEIEPKVRGEALWRVTGDEFFFAGHFPGEPIVPGVLLAEALAQLCGVVAFSGGDRSSLLLKPARLAQVDVKFLAAVRPPAHIELSATLTREMGTLIMFDVAAGAANAPAAEGRLVLSAGP